MKYATVTMEEDLLWCARVTAARAGKGPSRFGAETVEQRTAHPLSSSEARAQFLTRPRRPVSGGHGRAPSRAQRCDA
jgi:hypothetical protein